MVDDTGCSARIGDTMVAGNLDCSVAEVARAAGVEEPVQAGGAVDWAVLWSQVWRLHWSLHTGTSARTRRSLYTLPGWPVVLVLEWESVVPHTWVQVLVPGNSTSWGPIRAPENSFQIQMQSHCISVIFSLQGEFSSRHLTITSILGIYITPHNSFSH